MKVLDEQMSLHESAHAVARCHFRHPIAALELNHCTSPNEWQRGFTKTRLANLAKREVMEQHIICCLAGRAASDRNGAADDFNWRKSDDYQQAYDFSLELNSGDAEAAELFLLWLEHKAAKIVERKWPEIQRLSSRLIERRRLTGTEIMEILKTG